MENILWEPKERPREKGILKSLISYVKSTKMVEFKDSHGWDHYPIDVPARHCPNCSIFLLRGRFMKDE